MVYVDRERCTACGTCVEVCPAGAIRLVEEETGSYAEIDEATCRECEACVQACPEEAIVSESEPVVEGEVVQVKAAPVPVEPYPGEVRPVRAAPQALVWLGAALAFVGREIVPRLATSLLDAWDRRASRATMLPSGTTSERPAQQSMMSLLRGSGRRHRRRRRGG